MTDLEFRRIEIYDKARADEYLKKSDFRGCEYTFGNNFLWQDIYDLKVCFTEDFYFCKQNEGYSTCFIFPAGSDDIEKAVFLMKEYTDYHGIPLKFSANKSIAEKIGEMYKDCTITLCRNICDYVYNSDDLLNLSGRKYHAKRNHLNRFYENNWSFEPITPENISDCYPLLDKWKEENLTIDCADRESKTAESIVTECGLKHFDELAFTGGILRVDGEIQGFTFGERSSADCFVVHVEKALRNYQGAYTAINNQLVKSLNERYSFINREDDAGSENLRKAKLSYNPAFLEEKYYVNFGG